MHAPLSLATCVAHLLADRPQRVWSLVITLFGDAIAPRGGELALSSLLKITAALGIQDGAVRTAISRLAADGWLEARRRGRASYYRLTATGAAEFETATRRIYRGPPEPWDGTWHVVVLAQDSGTRERRRQELLREGYAALGPATFARPLTGRTTRGAGELLAIRGPAEDAEAACRWAGEAWPLAELDRSYGEFIARFAPLREAIAAAPVTDRLTALVARILLIHAYRRLALRDPCLPPELLPAGWAGAEAQQLCAGLYARLLAPSELWLDEHGRNERGALPPAGADFQRRFGGLKRYITENLARA